MLLQLVNVIHVLLDMASQVEHVQHVEVENIQQEEQEHVKHVHRHVIHLDVKWQRENVMDVMLDIISHQVQVIVQLVKH